MRVKCLAYKHNAMSPARSRTRTARSGVERTNHEATAPHTTLFVGNDINRSGLVMYNFEDALDGFVFDGPEFNSFTLCK